MNRRAAMRRVGQGDSLACRGQHSDTRSDGLNVTFMGLVDRGRSCHISKVPSADGIVFEADGTYIIHWKRCP